MKNNEDSFVTLIGKYVNRTNYLIFDVMSSAICIWTLVISVVWNMILSFTWIVASCGTQKSDPWIWLLPRCPAYTSVQVHAPDYKAAFELSSVELQEVAVISS